jgi:AraC-like DNA-binding protein
MQIQNIPETYINTKSKHSDLFVYDFKMTEDAVNCMVNLTVNMFSFLQKGEKKVQFANNIVEVNKNQSVLIKSGNCLMTELLNNDEIYFCKLFFFSNEQLIDFIRKYELQAEKSKSTIAEKPFFLIENDEFINTFVTSISSMLTWNSKRSGPLLAIKFEEIMLYLTQKYGNAFINYIHSLALPDKKSSFKKIIEANIYSNLSLSEIAFLANMSLSTFKRHFEKTYEAKPGKWLQQKRLTQAKRILEKGNKKPTEIFSDFGYTSFSNFSKAFKNEFGYSPKFCKEHA